MMARMMDSDYKDEDTMAGVYNAWSESQYVLLLRPLFCLTVNAFLLKLHCSYI